MNFSLETVKKNLKWIVCAFLGLFHFILLALPYVSAFASFGSQKESMDASGYSTLEGSFAEADAGFLVVMFQILAILCAVVLLILGLYVLTKAFFGEAIQKSLHFELPTQFGPIALNGTIAKLAILGYGILNVLVLLSLFIVGLANSQSAFGVKVGIGPAIGAYLAPLLGFGFFFGLPFLETLLQGSVGKPASGFVCEKCGASADASARFCGKCGGKIVSVKPQAAPAFDPMASQRAAAQTAPAYACSRCNAPSVPGTAFCSVCGGQIVAVAPQPAAPLTYSCERCGAPADKSASFCGKCGGKIIAK